MKFFLSTVTLISVLITLSSGFESLESTLHREPSLKNVKISRSVQTKWIEQHLDHFNVNNERTWQMRYLENNEYFEDGGAIFIIVGGEWPVSPVLLSGGHFHDIAKDLHGILFYTEHRFYGESLPTQNTSFANLQYLSVEQALGDLAHFITYIKETRPELKDAGVVLLGGSYSANVATWFKLKYPHLVNGVWASSAPLTAKVDFFEFREIVGDAIFLVGGQSCFNIFEQAYDELEKLISEGTPQRINDEFRLCTPLNTSNEMDVWYFYNQIFAGLSSVVQDVTPAALQASCQQLTDPKYKDALEAYADWTATYFIGVCLKIEYSSFVQVYRDVTMSPNSLRRWMWQTCTEVGWYATTGSQNQPFGTRCPVEHYLRMCKDLFDDSLTPNQIMSSAQRTNALYGATEPNVTNVYFTHGELDSWRAIGRQTDLNEHAPAVIIPMIGHVADIDSISSEDGPELLASKKRVAELIEKWLTEER